MQHQEKGQQQRKPAETVTSSPEATSSEPVTPAAETLAQAAQPDGPVHNAPVEPSLEEKLVNVEKRAEELQDAFLRAKAEVENLRRRNQEDIARTYKFAIANFAEALLPVKDSLETALKVETPSIESLKEGAEITLKQLDAAFKKNSLTEINPVSGDKLDPTKHEAISMVPAEQNPNTIVNVLQKGYMIAGRLLRPALVTVAQGESGQ
ncbi:MAG: nucleotide exchange factor GrpE [Burkholderiaceae bacterium]